MDYVINIYCCYYDKLFITIFDSGTEMIVITRVVLYSVIFWSDLRGGPVSDGPSRSAGAGMLQSLRRIETSIQSPQRQKKPVKKNKRGKKIRLPRHLPGGGLRPDQN